MKSVSGELGAARGAEPALHGPARALFLASYGTVFLIILADSDFRMTMNNRIPRRLTHPSAPVH